MPYSRIEAIRELSRYLSQHYETNQPTLTDLDLRGKFPHLAKAMSTVSLNYLTNEIDNQSQDPKTNQDDPITTYIEFVKWTEYSMRHNLIDFDQLYPTPTELSPELARLAFEFGRAIRIRP